jgi:diguanylate cyclase (GGDEF)-like protein/hemerythrin-like metal-binding protein/PAS domain S-box-containing protein
MGLSLMRSVDIFPWNKNFETGVPIIDEQHQKLVQLINLLASHLSSHSEESILLSVFDELADYALYHFETEEKVWHQFLPEDPLEVEHKKIHGDFIAEIQQLKQSNKNQSTKQEIEEVLRFLIHWLVFHILESDMYLAKVTQAIQSGMSPQTAKEKADQEMRQHIGVLVETILSMYEKMTSMALHLSSEIDSRKKAETKLRLASNVVENTLDAICVTNSDKKIIDANPAFYQTTQFTSEEVLGRNIEDLKTGLREEPLTSQLEKALLTDGQWSGIVSSRNKEGEVMMEWLSLSSIKNEHDDGSHYVAVFSEITHLADRLSDMEHLAYHDALTELPNRILLADRLELALANADRKKEFLAVCYLDLDGFKPINDQFGHEAGDEVLKVIAQRLLNVLRTNDTVSRVGGDEFVLLLGDLKKPEDYKELLARVLLEIEQPIQINEEEVSVTASIGVTIYPLDDSMVDDLIQHADRAMYQAKQAGASSYVLYSADH